MPTLTQILGGLLVAASLALAVHEVWLYTHPHAQTYTVTPRRLRRRLFGVAVMLALVAMLTWAGQSGDNRAKLALYAASMLTVLVLFALAMADVRETSTQILREHITQGSDEMAALLDDLEVRALVSRMGGGDLSPREAAETGRVLDERRGGDS